MRINSETIIMQIDSFDKQTPDLILERKLKKEGYRHITGLDEVGRGAIAGPVVAAAVCLSSSFIDNNIPKVLKEVRDSKELNSKKREEIFEIVKKNKQINFGIGIIPEKMIDKINILEATKSAMLQAINDLSLQSDFLILDGNFKIDSRIKQISIVAGDRKIFSVALASIVAKVTRDMIMTNYHDLFPKYGFNQNKGYATLLHRQAIDKHGSCLIHRKSFHFKNSQGLGKKGNI